MIHIRVSPAPIDTAAETRPATCGRVAFVGAGPRDPGLLTVRAAEALHLTPPAVTMQVKELESAVGLPRSAR